MSRDDSSEYCGSKNGRLVDLTTQTKVNTARAFAIARKYNITFMIAHSVGQSSTRT